MLRFLLAFLIAGTAFAQTPSKYPYVVTKQQMLAVGTAGQIRAGHTLATDSFPAAAIDTAKLSFWNLAGVYTDPYGSRALTAANTPSATTGISGTASEAIALVGASSQRLSSTDAFFQPYGSGGFSVGGWFKPTALSGVQILLARYNGTGNLRQWEVFLNGATLYLSTSSDGTVSTFLAHSFDVTGIAGVWTHLAVVWDTAYLTLYMNGKLLDRMPWTTFANVTPAFEVGSEGGGSSYFTGSVDELFYVKGVALSAEDIRKLMAYKHVHNKGIAAQAQDWRFNVFLGGASGLASEYSSQMFVVDKTSNAAWIDLSDLSTSDYVHIRMTNMLQ